MTIAKTAMIKVVNATVLLLLLCFYVLGLQNLAILVQISPAVNICIGFTTVMFVSDDA